MKIQLGVLIFAITIFTVMMAVGSYRHFRFGQRLDRVETKMGLGNDEDAYRIQIYGNDSRLAVLVLIRHHVDMSTASEFPTIEFLPSTPTTIPGLVVDGKKVFFTNSTPVVYLSSTGNAETIKLKSKHVPEIIDDFHNMKDSNQPNVIEFVEKWYIQQAKRL